MIFDMLYTYYIIEEINDSWKIIIRRQVENEFAIYMVLTTCDWALSQNDYFDRLKYTI